MIFRIKVWLSSISKRLDIYFTNRFWEKQKQTTDRLVKKIILDTENINIIK